MNNVYVRLILYVLSTVLAMVPAAWAGFVTYDAAHQLVTISLPGLASMIATALAGSAGVFKVWGVK